MSRDEDMKGAEDSSEIYAALKDITYQAKVGDKYFLTLKKIW